MKRVRTFIAIDPGQKIRDKMAALQKSLQEEGAEAKWVEPENVHLTLLFLGEVDMLKVPELCGTVSRHVQKFAGFDMTVETIGCFPNVRRPNVLWVGVTDGAEQVCAVHDALEDPLEELGCYRREDRKYTPHLTLGRVQKDRSRDLTAAVAKFAAWKGGKAAVNELLVMSSELTPKGPVYAVLSRAKLS